MRSGADISDAFLGEARSLARRGMFDEGMFDEGMSNDGVSDEGVLCREHAVSRACACASAEDRRFNSKPDVLSFKRIIENAADLLLPAKRGEGGAKRRMRGDRYQSTGNAAVARRAPLTRPTATLSPRGAQGEGDEAMRQEGQCARVRARCMR